ncbi:MAG: histidine phosphatase family protein [Bacteroidota bacterium]
MINIYLIRHAESMGNVNHHLIGGQSNHYPLTERGETQAHQLGKRLQQEGLHFDYVHASIAVRAQQTCQISCGHIGFDFAQVQHTDQIVELSQGEWEGQVRKDIYTPERKEEIVTNSYHFKAPQGESQKEVCDRMENWLLAAIEGLDPKEEVNIAGYSHGFAIKCLVKRLMNSDPLMTYRTIIHNTSITCFQFNGKNWLLERLNDHTHIIGSDFIGHYG